jgi:hypothetical protein
MHPYIQEALAYDRIATLRGATPNRSRRIRTGRRSHRERLGWLLVSVGLRLTTARPAVGGAARGAA